MDAPIYGLEKNAKIRFQTTFWGSLILEKNWGVQILQMSVVRPTQNESLYVQYLALTMLQNTMLGSTKTGLCENSYGTIIQSTGESPLLNAWPFSRHCACWEGLQSSNPVQSPQNLSFRSESAVFWNKKTPLLDPKETSRRIKVRREVREVILTRNFAATRKSVSISDPSWLTVVTI